MKISGTRSLDIIKQEVTIPYAVPRNNEYRLIRLTMRFMRNGMFKFTHYTEIIDRSDYRKRRNSVENKRKAYESMKWHKERFVKLTEDKKTWCIKQNQDGSWSSTLQPTLLPSIERIKRKNYA
mgnify:CR=1 FL=1|jgi:hypothetical protein